MSSKQGEAHFGGGIFPIVSDPIVFERMSIDSASTVWHIEIGERSLPIRMLRTTATWVIALLSWGAPGVPPPSNHVWNVVETASGRVLTTVKGGYGDETNHGTTLEADLQALSPGEFAARWGFSADI